MKHKSTKSGWERDDDRTAIHFRELLKDHVGTSRAVDWGSGESQDRRFAALLKPLELEGASILDVGCGQADLLEFLRRNDTNVQYEGIDLTAEMVDTCRLRFPDARFHQGSVLDLPDIYKDGFDYVIASGIFFLRETSAMEFLEDAVGAMFECCRSATSFNSLSTWNRDPCGNEFMADPLEVLRIASGLSSRIVFQHDYHPGDFTITIRRDEESR